MLFEPEETVGWIWHRLVGDAASYNRHPEAACGLTEMRARSPSCSAHSVATRGCGIAAGGRDVASATGSGCASGSASGASGWRRPALDGETLQLPPRIDCFPDRADNRLLYEWLAAWFAHAGASADTLR